MGKIKRIFIMVVCISPMPVFALAPMADSFYDYQKWMFPAYLYNFILGVILLVALTTVVYVWKKKLRESVHRLCDYLESHPSMAVVILGFLTAIPFGLLSGILYQLLWFIAMIPFLAMIIIFPIPLICKRFRNSLLLSCKFMTVLIIIAVSSLCASSFFIILTELGWLNNKTDYFLHFGANYEVLRHPFDSLKTVWSSTLFFICETPLCLLLLWAGKGLRTLNGRFRSKLHVNDVGGVTDQ